MLIHEIIHDEHSAPLRTLVSGSTSLLTLPHRERVPATEARDSNPAASGSAA